MLQTLRRKYSTTLGELAFSDLILTDETRVYLAMIYRCARATKGKRVYGKCPNNRDREKNIILMERPLH